MTRRPPERSDGVGYTADELVLTEGAHCSACGKPLPLDISTKNYIEGRWFCDRCLGKIKSARKVEETPQTLEQKAKFYEEVRAVFGITEIPDWWLHQMDKFFREGEKRNYSTANFVLYYVTKIRGIEPAPEFGLAFISRYYDEAKEFLENRRQVLLNNEKKGFTFPQRTVKIEPPQPRNKKLTNIEDL